LSGTSFLEIVVETNTTS